MPSHSYVNWVDGNLKLQEYLETSSIIRDKFVLSSENIQSLGDDQNEESLELPR